MTVFEKAIFSTLSILTDEFNEKLDLFSKEEFSKEKQQILEKIKSDQLFIKKLLWKTIKNRLKTYDMPGIGIRKGYYIVQFSPEENFLDMIMNSFLTEMIFEEDNHICENCGEYDVCDLPFKKKIQKKDVSKVEAGTKA